MNFENGKFYLSGPMTGVENFNVEAFNQAEAAIKEKYPDAVVLNPARHPIGLEYSQYMKYALIDVENSEIIVLLDGWHNSPGAQKERAHAVNLGKNIVKAETFRTEIPAKPGNLTSCKEILDNSKKE